ncbi:hypothetical protein LCGC14_0505530 [marine sediment metagenome]|uniref:Uncharacterized protein n=1 Tax=marine sediment metagenome TaxID=412755 RepID=A0A0F9VB68_9ZZZZ
MAGKQYTDKKVLKEVQSSGRIVLSLDGAQPVKHEPSLWVFSDRLTGNVLLACETPLIEAQRKKFNAQYATVRRTWRIREKDTGNFTQFKHNLTQLERT